MFRDTDEALKRLERQLLEEAPEAQEQELLDEDTLDALLEDGAQEGGPAVYQNFSNGYGTQLRNYATGYKAYNSDKTDTDLDSYSETVRQGSHHGGLVWLVVVLALLVIAAVAAVVWKFMGLEGLL